MSSLEMDSFNELSYSVSLDDVIGPASEESFCLNYPPLLSRDCFPRSTSGQEGFCLKRSISSDAICLIEDKKLKHQKANVKKGVAKAHNQTGFNLLKAQENKVNISVKKKVGERGVKSSKRQIKTAGAVEPYGIPVILPSYLQLRLDWRKATSPNIAVPDSKKAKKKMLKVYN